MDEARHAEVFRKRALAGGVGLVQALPQVEHSLKAILDGDTYSEASAFMHLLAEGNILTLFRFSEFISPTSVDKKMFRLVMQDEARHVSYGLQHLKWIIGPHPGAQGAAPPRTRRSGEHDAQPVRLRSVRSHDRVCRQGYEAGPDQEGVEIVGLLQIKQVEEYFHRLRRAGFEERIERSKFRELMAQAALLKRDPQLPD